MIKKENFVFSKDDTTGPPTVSVLRCALTLTVDAPIYVGNETPTWKIKRAMIDSMVAHLYGQERKALAEASVRILEHVKPESRMEVKKELDSLIDMMTFKHE